MISASTPTASLRVFAIHGFASSAAVWQPLLASTPTLALSAVNLPGHGGAPSPGASTLGALAAACAAEVQEPAVWIGWSLGGLIALHAAHRYPQKVQGVVAVAISPRFLATDDWSNALDASEFRAFEASLKSTPAKTLDRFYALQTHTRFGSSAALSRKLRSLSLGRGAPPQSVLEETLAILGTTDLRDEAATLSCPVLTVLGEDDALVPSGVCEDLSRLNPLWRVEIIEAAGHVPFLSHAEAFLALVESFIADISAERGAA
ncbi:MAG TPA: alpha/beta fold hydrolase [Gammaproteobacteria bacterium]